MNSGHWSRLEFSSVLGRLCFSGGRALRRHVGKRCVSVMLLASLVLATNGMSMGGGDSLRTVRLPQEIKKRPPQSPQLLEEDRLRALIFNLEPASLPLRAGANQILLTARPFYPGCDSVQLVVDELENLTYEGPRKWIVSFRGDSVFRTVLNVFIPEDDTSGLSMHGDAQSDRRNCAIYFVSDSDSVKVYPGRPHPSVQGSQALPPPSPDSSIPVKAEPRHISEESGRIRVDSSARITDPFPNWDTIGVVTAERLQKLEEHPLVTQTEQVVEVGGVRLIRRWGENRFQPLKMLPPHVVEYDNHGQQPQANRQQNWLVRE